MFLALSFLLSLAHTEARDLDLLDGGAQTWLSPDRVTRCPVHGKIEAVEADGGKGVSFVVEVFPRKRFSLLEKYMPAGGLQDYGGLQLNFTTLGLASWKLRLYDEQTNIRFVYTINKPDGAHSLTLPWSAFRPEKTRRCNVDPNDYSIQPSSISRLMVYLPHGPEQAQLTIQAMHAMRDLSGMALAAAVTAKDDMAEGFDGPFVGMGITGHNDFAMLSVNSPHECAEACTKTAGCRSFDYGARGSVAGECWLSLADRKSAGHAYQSWKLYNYYEIRGTSPDAATTKVTGNSDAEMSLSKDDLAAVMEYFDGPFVGMGITGHNDFGLVSVSDPGECAEACTKTAECRSFDYGARGSVAGECWLSLADRKSAGNAYRRWEHYNYYEIKAPVQTDVTEDATPMELTKKDEMALAKKDPQSETDIKENSTPMELAKKKPESKTNSTEDATPMELAKKKPESNTDITEDATPMELAKNYEMVAAKKKPESVSSDTSASHAQRRSRKPMACLQAVGALVFFVAS
jgi:hypothetical protein